MSRRSESEPFKAVTEALAGARWVLDDHEEPLLDKYHALSLTHAVFARLRQFGPLDVLDAIYGEQSDQEALRG